MDVQKNVNNNSDMKLVTVVQLATVLGCHRQTVARLARRGRIPSFKVGRDFRFELNAVMSALET